MIQIWPNNLHSLTHYQKWLFKIRQNGLRKLKDDLCKIFSWIFIFLKVPNLPFLGTIFIKLILFSHYAHLANYQLFVREICKFPISSNEDLDLLKKNRIKRNIFLSNQQWKLLRHLLIEHFNAFHDLSENKDLIIWKIQQRQFRCNYWQTALH